MHITSKKAVIALFMLLFAICLGGFAIAEKTGPVRKKQSKEQKTSIEKTSSAGTIHLVKIDAPITPVVAEYIVKSIERASVSGAEAIIIQLDTPGGLVDSMREIVKTMLASGVPTVVYVAPSGARAASAGVFITLAANIAAMAPSTNMGSAHPVQMEGKMDKTMEAKIVNDLAAMIRGIAEKRGRNVRWAEDAVRKSVSITEREAVRLNVIDLVAPDIPSLIKAIHGKTVETVMGMKVLKTSDAKVHEIKMGFRYKLLQIISNPNIAYILLILGFYGIYFELSNPGAIFPGVAGAICLILGFYALQTLPINYAGLMLILLGIGLLIAEAFVTSHGILGLGGAVALFIGSVMLIESESPFLRLSWAVIVPVVLVSSVLFVATVTVAIRVHKEKPDTGKEGLIGMIGEAISDIDAASAGQILVRGEIWSANSSRPIHKGDKVKVIAVEGLKLTVEKAA